MARSLHQLTIFVSGPSNVDSEKAALRVVVEEINRRLEKTHAVTLRVVGWPDDIRPGVSSDVQSEVNRQVGAEFDIYIGILASRFGTPTARAGSGTEDEFERALTRFLEDSTSVRVLFYFKRDVEDPFLLDIPQLQRVRRFRESLSGRGVLFRDFKDTGEFTNIVREHLDGLIIDEWRSDKWVQLPQASTQTLVDSASQPPTISPGLAEETLEVVDDEEAEEDLGILEYIAAFGAASDALIEVMTAISHEVKRIGEEIVVRSAEAEQVREAMDKQKAIDGSKTRQLLLGEARATVDKAAENLNEFVSGMTPRVEEYKVHSRAMFESVRNTFHASAELGERDNSEDRGAIAALIPVIRESREGVMKFQASINQVPALTGRFKRSRKRAAAVLGELVAEMSFSIENARAVLEEMGGAPRGEVS